MKILVSDQLEQTCIDILEREGFTVDNRPGLPAKDLLEVIGQYEGLVVRSATKVTAQVLERAAKLKIVGRAGTGTDNIDTPAATRRGILVMNTPGGNTVSAAEHTVSMMLALARNIPQARASLAAGEWERKKFTGTEVFEKTLGVVGLGKIGREVAARAQGLGMKIVGYDPLLASDVAGRLGIELASLDELFRRSDFITLHTPLTPETRNLINAASLAKCKKGVRIMNCARGGIVDESALLAAIESGHVAGAAIDVFEKEPPGDSPLVKHPRVVATPHLGASTEEAQEKVAVQIAHQMADAFHGRAYVGVVNSMILAHTMKDEVRPFMVLAEKLGSMAAQLAGGKVRDLTVSAFGDVPASSLELLKACVLKGVLVHTYAETLNYINAPFLAKEVGLTIGETKETAAENALNLVRLRFAGEGDLRELAGSVFGVSSVRLTRVDGFRVEAAPEGNLLIYKNLDRPGMLAAVGAILARHRINIAGVSLGRTEIGRTALTVMNVDNDVPSEAQAELNEVEGVSDLRLVRL
jgi:D-3-phosphoglycerate dehydrogenase